MILGNKIISPYYSGETDYLDKDKIIQLNYTETIIPGLEHHSLYNQMKSKIGCYISIDNIIDSVWDRTIPKQIFQTWNTKNLHNSFKLYQESWKRCNPDYKYVIFVQERKEIDIIKKTMTHLIYI